MKKIGCIVVCFALMLLSSCTPVSDDIPDLPMNADDPTQATRDEADKHEYRDFIYGIDIAVWNNMVFTGDGTIINLETEETFSACNDPLCDHTGEYCAENILKESDMIMVSPSSTKDDLVFYIYRSLFLGKDTKDPQSIEALQNHQIIRYHYFSGEIEILCENLLRIPGSPSIDPKNEEIYFPCYILNENGETEIALYRLDSKTKKIQIIDSYNLTIFPCYAIGDTVYCTASPSNGIVYSFDLSRERPVLEQTQLIYTNVHDGYAYYKEKVGEERLYVSDDVMELCEQYGETYKDFEIYDFYRVSILEKDAEPELVAERVLEGSRIGKYVYYCEYVSPEYHGSHLTFATAPEAAAALRSGRPTTFRLDDPDAPENAVLINIFTQEAGAMHILDADTLEPVTVLDSETYEFSPSGVRVAGDGALIRIYEKEAAASESGSDTTKSITGYLRFDKPYLTDEDIIPLQW